MYAERYLASWIVWILSLTYPFSIHYYILTNRLHLYWLCFLFSIHIFFCFFFINFLLQYSHLNSEECFYRPSLYYTGIVSEFAMKNVGNLQLLSVNDADWNNTLYRLDTHRNDYNFIAIHMYLVSTEYIYASIEKKLLTISNIFEL